MARDVRIHYWRPGKGTVVYHESLVVDRPDVKVTLLEKYAGPEVRAGDVRILAAGAPVVWYVFPGAWYDIGRFHATGNDFTGWYTNMCVPADITGADWSCTDLFLDHWMPASGAPAIWLDEEEFADAAERGVIDADTRRHVLAERERIDERVAAGAWPPDIAREIDLATALELVRA